MQGNQTNSPSGFPLCYIYSQYQINVSEIYSTLILYDGANYTEFTALAHVPLRPPNDYYTLSDVLSSGQSLDGSSINILAIVKHVRWLYSKILCVVQSLASSPGSLIFSTTREPGDEAIQSLQCYVCTLHTTGD